MPPQLIQTQQAQRHPEPFKPVATTAVKHTASYDTCCQLQGASIQHGHNSDRVYLMSMGSAAPKTIIPAIKALAQQHHYGKLIAKVPAGDAAAFLQAGFTEEARIPAYYLSQDALLLACYLDESRKQLYQHNQYEQHLRHAMQGLSTIHPKDEYENKNRNGVTQHQAELLQIQDAEAMAKLYRAVFPSYPFPIHQADFIRETMADNLHYFGIRDQQGALLALASAELDKQHLAVEMTDFATLPQGRGKSLAGILLTAMEQHVTQLGYRTAFTIARAASVAMNRTFYKQGYRYSGRLINNTQISGSIESMNIWHKPLQQPDEYSA